MFLFSPFFSHIIRQIDKLGEAEQEARKDKVQAQRKMEAEIHALRKEKKIFELERRQMTEAMAELRAELEELKQKKSSKQPAASQQEPSSVCIDCKRCLALTEFSSSQKRKRATERRCKKCAEAESQKQK